MKETDVRRSQPDAPTRRLSGGSGSTTTTASGLGLLPDTGARLRSGLIISRRKIVNLPGSGSCLRGWRCLLSKRSFNGLVCAVGQAERRK